MAYDITKTNSALGWEVEKMLRQRGVNTPMSGQYSIVDGKTIPITSKEDQIDTIKINFKNIMTVLGLNTEDDSLKETPRRVAEMFVKEIFWGLDSQNFPKCTAIENKMNYDEMVISKNITVQSVCEHHWVTINGKATVAYIPKNKVLGLSKINRIVEYFSRRPQIQERLTEQIYHTLVHILGTDDVAVLIDAQHFCVISRGVEDTNSQTVTSKLGGRFKDPDHPAARAEFMNIARSKN